LSRNGPGNCAIGEARRRYNKSGGPAVETDLIASHATPLRSRKAFAVRPPTGSVRRPCQNREERPSPSPFSVLSLSVPSSAFACCAPFPPLAPGRVGLRPWRRRLPPRTPHG